MSRLRAEAPTAQTSTWASVGVAMMALLTSGMISHAATGTTNLVAAANGGRIVHFTSQADDPAWATANLIDGKFVNYILGRDDALSGAEPPPEGSFGWSSASASFPQEIVFAFAGDESRLINKVVLDPRTFDPPAIGRWARDVEVLVSETEPDGVYQSVGGPWRLLNVPKAQPFEFTPVQARYVKLRILSNWGSDRQVELAEFEVYEAIVGTDQWSSVINRFDDAISDLERFREVTSERLEGTAGGTSSSGTSAETNLVAASSGGRIVAFSSQENDTSWAAGNLIDGLTVNYVLAEDQRTITDVQVPPEGINGWSSDTGTLPQEIVFAFAQDESKLINRVRLDPRTLDHPDIGRWARDVEVLATSNTNPSGPYVRVGGPWRLLRIPRAQTFEFDAIEARYVKLRITSNWGSDRCTELGEFEVYEAHIGANELDEIIGRFRQSVRDLMRLRDTVVGTRPEQPAATPEPSDDGG